LINKSFNCKPPKRCVSDAAGVLHNGDEQVLKWL